MSPAPLMSVVSTGALRAGGRRRRLQLADPGAEATTAEDPSTWERLCDAIGQPGLREDDRFTTFALRDEHRGELLAVLEPVFCLRSTVEWVGLLGAAGVPCGPVNDVAAALADVQVGWRWGLVEVGYRVLGCVRRLVSLLGLGGFEAPAGFGLFRGELRRALLAGLCGCWGARIAALERDGVFGVFPSGAGVAG